jgi:hypothetical protein
LFSLCGSFDHSFAIAYVRLFAGGYSKIDSPLAGGDCQ